MHLPGTRDTSIVRSAPSPGKEPCFIAGCSRPAFLLPANQSILLVFRCLSNLTKQSIENKLIVVSNARTCPLETGEYRVLDDQIPTKSMGFLSACIAGYTPTRTRQPLQAALGTTRCVRLHFLVASIPRYEVETHELFDEHHT